MTHPMGRAMGAYRLFAMALGLTMAVAIGCSDDEDRTPGTGTGIGTGGQGNTGNAPPVEFASCTEAFAEDDSCPAGQGQTYYVSSSEGDDANDGLSEDSPLDTIAAVNDLALEPGDMVLLRCGDTWRGEMLTVTRSGEECQHIIVGSYPDRTCEDQPVLSGSHAVTGWSQHSGNIWVADLDADAFPGGLNQLFRGEQRLPMGKWPNADDPAHMHGYSTIDRQPDETTIEDDDLPPGDYAGAIVRLKQIRWLLLSRRVQSSSAGQLVLESGVSCWGGTCGDAEPANPDTHGWGYLVTNHLSTLDQEGEWFYDEAARQVYLVSAATPEGIEGSVIPDWVEEDSDWRYTGGVILGANLAEHIQYVVIENLRVESWFSSGITTPINLELDDNSNLTIRCNTIRNVESVGLNLATWVWNAGDDSGWRGGHDMVVSNNVIDGPNHFGITTYATRSTFQDNLVTNVGLADNLGAAGLGCGFEGANCTENGDGIRVVLDQAAFSAHSLHFVRNRVERTGYCGFDLFGSVITLEHNVIREACFTKGDCGAVRTFGRDSFAESDVEQISLRNNVIVDVIGNTDGDNSDFKTLFGFGLYIDHYSKSVVSEGNTIVGATASGILYQDSQGTITNNTVYHCQRRQIALVGETTVASMTGNVLYALEDDGGTLSLEPSSLTASDDNAFFAPYQEQHINAGGNLSLADWQAQSGLDGASIEAWFSLGAGAPPRSTILVNDTAAAQTMELGSGYVDVQQAPLDSSVSVAPFSSQIGIGSD